MTHIPMASWPWGSTLQSARGNKKIDLQEGVPSLLQTAKGKQLLSLQSYPHLGFLLEQKTQHSVKPPDCVRRRGTEVREI